MTQEISQGRELTEFLLAMSGLEPCRILDWGADDGSAVRLLLEAGFFAEGIDREAADQVQAGDLFCCPYEDGSFDAVLSEGVCWLSGEPDRALAEMKRLLKPGGVLLLADVSFQDSKSHVAHMEELGFRVLHVEDATELWAETAEPQYGDNPMQTFRYLLSVCEKQ